MWLISLLFLLQIKGYWLQIANTPNISKIKEQSKILNKNPLIDGDIIHLLILPPEEEEEHPSFKLLLGPFDKREQAFAYGIKLVYLKKIQYFTVVNVHGTKILIKIPQKKRIQLIPFETNKPYPQMGISLSGMVLCYPSPSKSIPPMERSISSLGYRDEFWILKEKLVCNKEKCKRWFFGLTPYPHTLGWVTAGFVVPISKIRSIKNEDGRLKAYTVVDWYAKINNKYEWWATIFAPGKRPLRWYLKTRRFFYLRIVFSDNHWKILDARNVEHAILKNSDAQWRPVSTLFLSKNRRKVFD